MQGLIIGATGLEIGRLKCPLIGEWKLARLLQVVRLNENLGIAPFNQVTVTAGQEFKPQKIYLTNLESGSCRLFSQVTGVDQVTLPVLPGIDFSSGSILALQSWNLEGVGPKLNYCLVGKIRVSGEERNFVYLFQGFPYSGGVAQTFGSEPFPDKGEIYQPGLKEMPPAPEKPAAEKEVILKLMREVGTPEELGLESGLLTWVDFGPLQWIVGGKMVSQFSGLSLCGEAIIERKKRLLDWLEKQRLQPAFVLGTTGELGTDPEKVFSETAGSLRVFGPVAGLDLFDPTKAFVYFWAEKAEVPPKAGDPKK
jgi:hypothetical protein